MELGRIGIWTSALDARPAREAQELAVELEALGYGAIWFPESVRREPFANAGLLLAATQRIVLATGIANIYARDAVTMAAGWKTLTEAYPDRFLLGLGVSHLSSVESLRGHRYLAPVPAMAAYLDAMDRAPYEAAPPVTEPRRLLAALGPLMLRLAGRRTWGAHPYLVPVEHTRVARAQVGPQGLVAPEQAVVLESDPALARTIARAHTRAYLRQPNYANNLRRLGFAEEELAEGGNDRLVDSIVAWGSPEEAAGRVREHLAAGADHVSIQVLGRDSSVPPVEGWRALAPLLLG